MHKSIARIAAPGFCLVLAFSSAKAQLLQTIALSGDPVLTAGEGVTIESFENFPAFNDRGDVAFVGHLSGRSFNDKGVFAGNSMGYQPLLLSGDPAPGTTGTVNFRSSSINSHEAGTPQIYNNGQVLFGALPQPGTSDSFATSTWIWNGSEVELFQEDGDPLPQLQNDEDLAEPIVEHITDLGDAVFFAPIVNSFGVKTGSSLWTSTAAGLRLIARNGDPAPGTASTFSRLDSRGSFFPVEDAVLDSQGRTTFVATVDGLGRGIWRESTGNLEAIVVPGQSAPGLQGDLTFQEIGDSVNIRMNESGQALFSAFLAGDGEATDDRNSIWLEQEGQLRLVVREGSPAFDTEDLRVYGPPMAYELADSGAALFGSTLTDPTDGSLTFTVWVHEHGTNRLAFERGMPAPGTEDPTKFGYISALPQINDSGQVAFFASIFGPDVDESNSQGIWAEDLRGELQLIVRQGDQIEVAPGDYRFVESLGYGDFMPLASDNSHDATYINNRGQVIFRAEFTDGTSGIFISNLVAVPESSSIALLILGSVGCAVLRS